MEFPISVEYAYWLRNNRVVYYILYVKVVYAYVKVVFVVTEQQVTVWDWLRIPSPNLQNCVADDVKFTFSASCQQSLANAFSPNILRNYSWQQQVSVSVTLWQRNCHWRLPWSSSAYSSFSQLLSPVGYVTVTVAERSPATLQWNGNVETENKTRPDVSHWMMLWISLLNSQLSAQEGEA